MDARTKLSDLRVNRFNKSLSQEKVANCLGLSKLQQYQRYEYGDSKLPKNIIENASVFFKVGANYFLDRGYGDTIFNAPYFKGYDFKKNRIIYYDLNEKSKDIYIGNEYYATNFFIVDLHRDKLTTRTKINYSNRTLFKETRKNHLIINDFVPLSNIARFAELERKEYITSILMMKCTRSDLEVIKEQNLYLVADKKTHNYFLAFIRKHKFGFEIIYIFDFEKYSFVDHYPFLHNELVADLDVGVLPDDVKYISIDHIEVIGKTISIWDPHNILPLYL